MSRGNYRKLNDRSQCSSTYHKKDGTNVRAILKDELRHALVKFNGGKGALLCNNCKVIIADGFDHEDRDHYCNMCMSSNCKVKSKGNV